MRDKLIALIEEWENDAEGDDTISTHYEIYRHCAYRLQKLLNEEELDDIEGLL